MEMFPVTWSFKRKPYLQILEAKGECYISEGADVLLASALEFIDVAEKHYNACLFSEEPKEQAKEGVAVYFSLIFRTEEDINKFFKAMQGE